jgi:hypothetical protein
MSPAALPCLYLNKKVIKSTLIVTIFVENYNPSTKGGRPRKKVRTEPLKLRLDPTTSKMLEELQSYGRLGTTKQDIVMHIVRSWLWEHENRLRVGIASKESPLGNQ